MLLLVYLGGKGERSGVCCCSGGRQRHPYGYTAHRNVRFGRRLQRRRRIAAAREATAVGAPYNRLRKSAAAAAKAHRRWGPADTNAKKKRRGTATSSCGRTDSNSRGGGGGDGGERLALVGVSSAAVNSRGENEAAAYTSNRDAHTAPSSARDRG